MIIGIKKFAIDISIYKKKVNWHTGKYTLNIWIIRWDKYEDCWVSNRWWFIPIGKRIKDYHE